jgi:ParB family chromosome partitioning protein
VSENLVTVLDVGSIVAGDNGTGHQDRESFDPDALCGLAASIERDGLASPPLVRPAPGRAGTFELIAGERRVRAMRDVLGWEKIPCLVRDLSDAAARALMFAENDARADLALSEQARAIAARRRPDQSVAAIAAELGHTERWAANRLALLKLDAPVLALVDSGQLPLLRGVMLADLPAAAQRAAVAAAGDASGDVFSRLVGELAATANQAAMFDAGAYELTQQQWDTAAGAYVEGEQAEISASERDGELLGVQEIAAATGRTVAAIWQAKKRGRIGGRPFPAPDQIISSTPIWRRGTLRAAGLIE